MEVCSSGLSISRGIPMRFCRSVRIEKHISDQHEPGPTHSEDFSIKWFTVKDLIKIAFNLGRIRSRMSPRPARHREDMRPMLALPSTRARRAVVKAACRWLPATECRTFQAASTLSGGAPRRHCLSAIQYHRHRTSDRQKPRVRHRDEPLLQTLGPDPPKVAADRRRSSITVESPIIF
jgi:hypothetical protein